MNFVSHVTATLHFGSISPQFVCSLEHWNHGFEARNASARKASQPSQQLNRNPLRAWESSKLDQLNDPLLHQKRLECNALQSADLCDQHPSSHFGRSRTKRLEAIATRSEAIAIRLDAIATRWRPLLLGWRPSLLGWRPSLLGWRPSLLGWRPSLLGWRPSVLGWRPSVLGWRPSLLGRRPSLLGWRPSLLGGGHCY